MSEVAKMYENAGVEYGSCQNYSRLEQCCNSPFCDSGMCPNGIGGEKHLFTAEKQLLLLQWLLDKTDLYLHRHKTDFTYSIASGDIAVNKYKDFKESIAEFINAIWQDLTEQERTEIKRILE